MKRAFVCMAALAITAVLAALFPVLRQQEPVRQENVPLVLWTAEENVQVTRWLKKAAAAYEKAQETRVYLRVASLAEMEAALALQPGTVLPDAMVAAGEGVEVCSIGYALVVPDAAAVNPTPLPEPALFYRPTATPSLSTPRPRPFPAHLQQVAAPACLAGKVEGSYESRHPLQDLQSGKAHAALLTPDQAKQMQAGYTAHARQDLFVQVRARGITEDGQRFLSFLRSDAGQLLLGEYALFSWNRGFSLYNPETTLLYQMENVRRIGE